MNGFLITFYTELNQRYHNQPIHEWLVNLTKELGLRGVTVLHGSEGIDHTGKLHSMHFFEAVDQPVQIQFALDEAETTQLFDYLNSQNISIFYVKTPMQFGVVGNQKGE
ncbi:DUF190 domain-containing protein [Acinetobacter baumannii]|uniref:DUF190 domain-containing protein n=2 Tax=Acinetobacter baumannii TaxID=470 RepID=A0A9P2LBG9_ACIBA|nr:MULTISPECIES: DUF190 domain-containing protein [Acinetobacter calcoaceticus/baumannii complex]EKT7958546.1 DUF190 domain-containing protein [Acinetobacter baumannii]EKT8144299.1 DUF190 domain-containing protein [Acinetobacter baumannii]EKT9272696.1 DUF190 domain-containing protein [Acinetobacter baumannii]EKT9314744.1 DUF190 domain-containing protein [Acinetobacter baumannii]EKU0110730.1 DUF190 domain-containing protein [Acinetobacter baumannii]